MLVVALAGATHDAKITRAQSQVQHINQILLTRFEEEATKRMPLIFKSSSVGTRFSSAMEASEFRLALLRDYLRAALPDRKSDILQPAAPIYAKLRDTSRNLVPNLAVSPPYSSAQDARRSIVEVERERYLQRLRGLLGVSSLTEINQQWSAENESSECLYLILSTTQIDGSPVIQDIRSSAIVDGDGDGVPEILDPWDTPVHWIRWPAGYWLTYNIRDLPRDPTTSPEGPRRLHIKDQVFSLGAESIDYLRVDAGIPRRNADWPSGSAQPQNVPQGSLSSTYGIFPIVVSAGPDREFDLLFRPDYSNNIDPYLRLVTKDGSSIAQGYAEMEWPFNGIGGNGRLRYPDPFCRFYVNFDAIYVTGYDKMSRSNEFGLPGAYFDSNGDMEDQSTDNLVSYVP
jgi:hypothetical protein